MKWGESNSTRRAIVRLGRAMEPKKWAGLSTGQREFMVRVVTGDIEDVEDPGLARLVELHRGLLGVALEVREKLNGEQQSA